MYSTVRHTSRGPSNHSFELLAVDVNNYVSLWEVVYSELYPKTGYRDIFWLSSVL